MIEDHSEIPPQPHTVSFCTVSCGGLSASPPHLHIHTYQSPTLIHPPTMSFYRGSCEGMPTSPPYPHIPCHEFLYRNLCVHVYQSPTPIPTLRDFPQKAVEYVYQSPTPTPCVLAQVAMGACVPVSLTPTS